MQNSIQVLQLISSAGFYGAENMLINLARSLNQFGCRSTVGVFENTHRHETGIADQARLEGLPVVLFPCNGRADWNAARAIRSYVEAHGIDIVHTHGYKADLYGYAAVRRFGTPIVATCHNWPGGSLALSAYAALDRRILRHFPKVVAVSEAVSRMLQDSGVPLDRITMINNGIDLSRFDGASPTLASEITKGCRPVVGTVGRLAPEKGLEHFLRAAKLLLGRFPEALFVLVGEGPERRPLEVLSQELGIEHSVVFTGQRRDLPGIYASLDVFVLSSLNEGMPMTILEAMAAARAVVATRVGAIPRLVVPGSGLLVEPGDPTGICDAVGRLLADPGLGNELGKRARERVAQVCSAEGSAEVYAKLYRELMERPSVCATRPPVKGTEAAHSTVQVTTMERPDAGGELQSSMGSSSSQPRPIKVFLMDLWCCVPYYTSHLTKGLKALDVAVTLGSVNYYLDDQCFRRLGVQTAPGLLDVISRLKIRRPFLRRALRLAELWANMMALAVRFVLSRPDLIHVQYLPFLEEKWLPFELWFLEYARKLGIRLVFTVHNVLPPDKGLRCMAAFRRAYHLADALICMNQEAKNRLTHEFSISSECIRIIPHGPLFHDLPRLSLAAARARLKLSQEERVVLFQGILKPYKGAEFLLEAWASVQRRNPQARLVIAGTGEKRFLEAIEAKVRSLGVGKSVRLEFRFVPAEELNLLYQAADVLVYPYREITTSGALLTGLSYGKPIVATSLPAFRETLQNGEFASLVDYGDVEGLAGTLTGLLQDPVEYARLQRAATSVSQTQNDWLKIGHETRRCYEEVLELGTKHEAEVLCEDNGAALAPERSPRV